ncbi:MAG TPA: hypothetical protein VKU44_03170 [Terriglobia bacterium]|nr:hypothetical protein [Terriglobia bacterium]
MTDDEIGSGQGKRPAGSTPKAARRRSRPAEVDAIGTRLDALIQDGKVFEQERGLELTTLRALTPSKREKRFRDLESRRATRYPDGEEIDLGPAGEFPEEYLDPEGAKEWRKVARDLARVEGKAPDAAAVVAEIRRRHPIPPWMKGPGTSGGSSGRRNRRQGRTKA